MIALPQVHCCNDNDFKILYLDGIDSGGLSNRDTINQVVKRTGSKQQYTHAHEWCCGHGAMGFNLLQKGMCDRLTLSDIDYNCVMGCQYTVAANNLKDKVDIFLIEKFSDIPVPSQLWDLIITNPPYVPDLTFYEKSNNLLDDRTKTMWVDPDWQAHINFFANLKKYITQDCDIYMFGIAPFIDQQISLAKEYGFKVIQQYDDLKIPGAKPLELLHFCPQ